MLHIGRFRVNIKPLFDLEAFDRFQDTGYLSTLTLFFPFTSLDIAVISIITNHLPVESL